MIFFARPLSVFADCYRSVVLICVSACLSAGWITRRGANHPGRVPDDGGAGDARLFFNVAFFVVLVSLLLQEHHSRGRRKKPKWSFRQWDVGVTRWSGYSSGKSVGAVCLSLSADKWCVGAALRDLHMPKGRVLRHCFVITSCFILPAAPTARRRCVVCNWSGTRSPGARKLFSQSPPVALDQRFFGDFISKPAPNMQMWR